MVGTKAGGKKAHQTNIERHGSDFYSRIGAKGGHNGHTGGFQSNRKLASIAGTIGGLKSSRKGVKNGQGKERVYKPVWGE